METSADEVLDVNDQSSGAKNAQTTNSIGHSTTPIGESTNVIGDSAWADLFVSRTLARLLTTLLTHPEEDFYQKELVEAAATGLYAVQRELVRLERAGLVSKTPRGNRVYYRANRKHPAFEDLKRVVVKTWGLGEALRAGLAPLAGRVRVAFIYGSFARGEETASSDLDILLVGDLPLRDASSVLGPLSRELGREFNPAIYPPDEFRAKAREGHDFIAEVLKGEKIFLIGDEHELTAIVG